MPKITNPHCVVVNVNVAHRSTRLAPYGNARADAKGVVPNRDIVRGPRGWVGKFRLTTVQGVGSIPTTPCLDGNVIVADTYVIVLDHYVPTRIRIESIHVGRVHFSANGQVVHVHVLAIDGMNRPKGRVPEGEVRNFHLRHVDQLYQVGSSGVT